MTNYQDNFGEENRDREELFKFYNRIKTTQTKCNYGEKDCSTCEDTACRMRPYLLVRPY